MKERPILFSALMVRAILEGRKTQTRRIIKPQPHSVEYWRHGQPSDRINGLPSFREKTGQGWAMCGPFRCPYIPHGLCAAGERGALINSNIEDKSVRTARLWVRETWAPTPGGPVTKENGAIYRATQDGNWLWRPSIHMPRWASRITLEVTHIRVERLQEISEEDAKAEGVHPCGHDDYHTDQHTCAYKALWESINGRGSWAANPWVWVIHFKRVVPAPASAIGDRPSAIPSVLTSQL